MFTVRIKTENEEKTLKYSKKTLISDILADAGISIAHPCGGRGICGKCRVAVSGNTAPAPDNGTALACRTYVCGDAVINCGADIRIAGITHGTVPEYAHDPLVNDGFGAAVDIGTTTVAVYIYDMRSHSLVKKLSAPNPQMRCGADVISRISRARGGGLDIMRGLIHGLIQKMCEGYDIKKYVVCGNTIMLHIFAGLDPSPIAAAPFTPASLFGEDIENAYIPRCIGPFIGADITCAILASGITEKDTALLCDIGTNSEIVLKNGNSLICCSAPAGPALEGAQISCGTPAVPGAVDRVFIADKTLKYTTVDSAPPSGICGSGITDAVACMKRLGIIDSSGHMEKPYELCENVIITPGDIRAYQLAKAAVRACIELLLARAGIGYSDIEALFIAGGFGNSLNKHSAAAVGLIPYALSDKTVYTGNSAGTGAAMILNSRACLEKANAAASCAVETEAADDPLFEGLYLKYMSL